MQEFHPKRTRSLINSSGALNSSETTYSSERGGSSETGFLEGRLQRPRQQLLRFAQALLADIEESHVAQFLETFSRSLRPSQRIELEEGLELGSVSLKGIAAPLETVPLTEFVYEVGQYLRERKASSTSYPLRLLPIRLRQNHFMSSLVLAGERDDGKDKLLLAVPASDQVGAMPKVGFIGKSIEQIEEARKIYERPGVLSSLFLSSPLAHHLTRWFPFCPTFREFDKPSLERMFFGDKLSSYHLMAERQKTRETQSSLESPLPTRIEDLSIDDIAYCMAGALSLQRKKEAWVIPSRILKLLSPGMRDSLVLVPYSPTELKGQGSIIHLYLDRVSSTLRRVRKFKRLKFFIDLPEFFLKAFSPEEGVNVFESEELSCAELAFVLATLFPSKTVLDAFLSSLSEWEILNKIESLHSPNAEVFLSLWDETLLDSPEYGDVRLREVVRLAVNYVSSLDDQSSSLLH